MSDRPESRLDRRAVGRFFEPDSVSWRVIGHPVALVGGMRALIVQTMHPLAMAGVAAYSDFRADPLKRLRGTSAYVASVVFGDRATALAAVARVKKLHARVRGVDPVTGRPFSADDPETMLWVHCTEIHSFLAAYRAYAGHLTRAERDRYLAEQVVAAELIGVPRAMVPDSVEAYRAYFAGVRPRLCVSAEAAETIDFIVRPRLSARTPLDLRLAATLFGPAAAALVPRDLRRLAGLPDRPRREIPLRAVNGLAWRVAPLLGRVPVLSGALDAWAAKLVGETPVRLALHQARARR
ncbi:MAG: DUF2236 domain-containing protein, partial [Labilithrix sp.]|nr:DUF2236 domain-containing protein [Labilithrix sp.]